MIYFRGEADRDTVAAEGFRGAWMAKHTLEREYCFAIMMFRGGELIVLCDTGCVGNGGQG